MRVEVLGGVERRRRWSRDDKMRIIEETLGARRGCDGDRAAARHFDEFGVHVAAAGSPGECRFGGTEACPCSAHPGCGGKRPIN